MTRKKKAHKELSVAFLAGIIGGILTWFATDFMAVKQDRILLSSVAVDSNEARQGNKSLRWDFTLQPAKKYMFSPTQLVGGLLHLEVRPDKEGNVNGLNLLKYEEIRFFVKASCEMFLLNEINLFTGPNFIQYTYSTKEAFFLNTKWSEYRISLDKFFIAPWEHQYRPHLATKNHLSAPNMKEVSGLGFDLKTNDKALSGSIWVDYVRLIDKKGNEEILSDGSELNLNLFECPLIWIAGAREYP